MRKNVGLAAVWDEDLHALLDSLGVLDDLLTGNMRCTICSCVVDFDNLGTIIPAINDVRLTCDDASCVRAVTSREMLVSNG